MRLRSWFRTATMVAVPLMVVAACARTAPPSDGGPDRPRFVTSFGPSTDQPIPDYRQAYDVAADAAKVWFRNDLGDADWRKALARAATDDFARRVRAAEVARPASGSLRPTVTGAVAQLTGADRVRRPDRHGAPALRHRPGRRRVAAGRRPRCNLTRSRGCARPNRRRKAFHGVDQMDHRWLSDTLTPHRATHMMLLIMLLKLMSPLRR